MVTRHRFKVAGMAFLLLGVIALTACVSISLSNAQGGDSTLDRETNDHDTDTGLGLNIEGDEEDDETRDSDNGHGDRDGANIN